MEDGISMSKKRDRHGEHGIGTHRKEYVEISYYYQKQASWELGFGSHTKLLKSTRPQVLRYSLRLAVVMTCLSNLFNIKPQ